MGPHTSQRSHIYMNEWVPIIFCASFYVCAFFTVLFVRAVIFFFGFCVVFCLRGFNFLRVLLNSFSFARLPVFEFFCFCG